MRPSPLAQGWPIDPSGTFASGLPQLTTDVQRVRTADGELQQGNGSMTGFFDLRGRIRSCGRHAGVREVGWDVHVRATAWSCPDASVGVMLG
jgi:hypothetical protein